MAQNTAATVTVPSGIGSSGDSSQPSNSQPRGLGGRRRANWAAELHIKLDAVDARSLDRLRQAYGRDAASIIRDLIREKYADLQEVETARMHPDSDAALGLLPATTSRGK